MNIMMFPGQGSQHSGMGADLFEQYPDYVSLASSKLGYDVKAICLDPDGTQLNETYYTQPLLYLVCCLAYLNQVLRPDLLIGHSLGLYAALFASGMIDFEQGLTLVEKRAKLMSESSGGGMLAVIGLAAETLNNFLIANDYYDIVIANDNSPSQQILSGDKQSLAILRSVLTKQFDCRAISLPVSGAFHSPMMADAAHQYYTFVADFAFKVPTIPVISSTHGEAITVSHALEALSFQLTEPVNWRLVIQSLLKAYPKADFIEVGPGHVLTKLCCEIKQSLEMHATQECG